MVEQPPNPPNRPTNEPDHPKPPIWERPAASIPPMDVPQPIVPDISAPEVTPVVPRVTATPPVTPAAPLRPPVTAMPPTMPLPPVAVTPPTAPLQMSPTPTPGPTFAEPGSVSTPATGMGAGDRPWWPIEPPTIGHQTSASPAPSPKKRRRVGLVALGLLLVAALSAAAFLFGRSFGSSETAAEPSATDTPALFPTEVPATEVPATEVPVPASPAPIPTAPPVNDAAGPLLPGDLADEPVAAVAAAVAPAVVLIQNDLGQGSGIIYDDSGLILTNAHVVGQFTAVRVTLASGVTVDGEVLGRDEQTDVAVVEINTDAEYGVAVLAPDSSVEVGQLAVAIGSPFGLEQTVTSGIISAKGRVLVNPIEDGTESIVAMIQTDAPINPGNSGGALADRQGRVVGMNTSIRTDGSGGNIGVGFAIPSDTAKLIADRIIAGEPLEQGFLGISNGGTPAIGKPGAVIGAVEPGSGVAVAGLLPGDLITEFNGEAIKSISDLAAAVRLLPPGEEVTVIFDRAGESLQVQVTLGTYPEGTG